MLTLKPNPTDRPTVQHGINFRALSVNIRYSQIGRNGTSNINYVQQLNSIEMSLQMLPSTTTNFTGITREIPLFQCNLPSLCNIHSLVALIFEPILLLLLLLCHRKQNVDIHGYKLPFIIILSFTTDLPLDTLLQGKQFICACMTRVG